MSVTFTPAFRPITPEYLKGGRLLQLLDAWGWHMQKALQNPQDGAPATADRVMDQMKDAWNSLLPLADPGENWQFRQAVDGLTRQRSLAYVSGDVERMAALRQALTDVEMALESAGMGGDSGPHGLQNIELTVVLDENLGPRFEARDVSPPGMAGPVDEKAVSMIVVMVIGGLLGIAAILMIVWLARRRKRRQR